MSETTPRSSYIEGAEEVEDVNFIEYMLLSPGLSAIASKIFLNLDPRSLSQVQLVSKLWRRHVREHALWRKKLIQVAPPSSYERSLLLRSGWTALIPGKMSPRESKRDELLNRKLCYRLIEGIEKDWLKNNPLMHIVRNARLVRLMRVQSCQVIYSSGASVQVACRQIHFDGIQLSFPILRSNDSAHHMEVYAMDCQGDYIVLGGRDRILSLWDKTILAPIDKVMNAHLRLITSLIIKGDIIISTSRDRTAKLWKMQLEEIGNY